MNSTGTSQRRVPVSRMGVAGSETRRPDTDASG